MNTCDGNKMLNNNGSVKMVKCSRWVELSDEVMKVADVSSALNARTDFHLLNPTPNLKQCSIATSAWEGVAPLGPRARPRFANPSTRSTRLIPRH